MPRYLISFDDGAMDHIPDEDLPSVSEATHKVVREAKAAGVWIFGGGVQRQQSGETNRKAEAGWLRPRTNHHLKALGQEIPTITVRNSVPPPLTLDVDNL